MALEEAFAGAKSQKRLEILAEHLKPLRLTTSFCRTVMNLILLGSLIWLFGAPLSLWRMVGAVACSGAIIALFGVAIPHAWAAYAGEKILATTLGVLLIIRVICTPITAVMASVDVPIRRLAGISGHEKENGDSVKQEILQAASEGQAEGSVDAEEVQMIESVMEFGDTRAGEIMTPRTDIFALPFDTPWDEAIQKIVAAGHTRVPVYQGDLDNIVGILYAKDMLKYNGRRGQTQIKDLLRKCYFVPETKPLDDLLKEFKRRKVHMAVLLDEYGGTAGLVTIEDVLEEIVGDIADEYDEHAPPPMQKLNETSIEVDGRVRIDELNDTMQLELPEDKDYDTVAGFIFSALGYIPKIGETLLRCGVKFTILAADERKITRLRIEVLHAKKTKQD